MPRKTFGTGLAQSEPLPASMRPRPDAAENRTRSAVAPWGCAGFNEAAARCRGKPVQGFPLQSDILASMRPRPDAAENPLREPVTDPRPQGFNEAAARCRGKPDAPRAITGACGALQ